MDEVRLRALAETFYQRSLPSSHDREFWIRHYLDFAHKVLEPDRTAFRLIRDMAQTRYEQLPPRDRILGIGRVLRNISEVADAAFRGE